VRFDGGVDEGYAEVRMVKWRQRQNRFDRRRVKWNRKESLLPYHRHFTYALHLAKSCVFVRLRKEESAREKTEKRLSTGAQKHVIGPSLGM